MSQHERDLVVRVALILAIPLAFVVLIPSLLGVGLAVHESRQRSHQNAVLIGRLETALGQVKKIQQEQTNARVQNRARFADSDIQICKTTENLKSALRSIVRFDVQATRLTIQQLGLDPDTGRGKQLFDRSKQASVVAENKLKPRKNGCLSLPSVHADEPQK